MRKEDVVVFEYHYGYGILGGFAQAPHNVLILAKDGVSYTHSPAYPSKEDPLTNLSYPIPKEGEFRKAYEKDFAALVDFAFACPEVKKSDLVSDIVSPSIVLRDKESNSAIIPLPAFPMSDGRFKELFEVLNRYEMNKR